MSAHRTAQAPRRTSSRKRALCALGVAAAVVLAASPAAQGAGPAEPDYGITLEQSYLTSDVGGTVTLRPKVFTSRADGSRDYVPEGAPVGPGLAIEYALPMKASLVGLDRHKSCRATESKWDKHRQHVLCDTVAPLTFRVDKVLIPYEGGGDVRFFPERNPQHGENWEDNQTTFSVAAPAPREEGETEAGRARREAVGVKLFGVAGGFGVLALLLVLFLARSRVRRAAWVASCTAAALCAGLGTWSTVEGPLRGTKTYTRYPAGPAVLRTPDLIWDDGMALEKNRPDYVPPIATAPDPGRESVTEVSAFYSAEAMGLPRESWMALDGAYGRIEDPRRARNHMLETAAGAPGAKVVKKPQLILERDGMAQKKLVLFKCQALSIQGQTVTMCAWADSGVRALVTSQGDSLLKAANTARALRDTVQLGSDL
jgi:hypothetical protein